jgi:Fur family ferric uptake transcriptional regulator
MRAAVVEEIVDRLREQGLRATTPRRIIVEALLDHPQHVTAEGLAALVHDRAPLVNVATVYRTLESLQAIGVIDRVPVDQGPAQWHVVDDSPHQHLVCKDCGEVTEVSSKEFERLVRALDAAYGFKADGHAAIPGQCAACAAKQPRVRPVAAPARRR